MKQGIFVFCIAFIAACNYDDNKSVPADKISAGQGWDSVSRYNFLNACIDEQQAVISDTLAYGYCRCMLEQLEQRYSHPDSISVIDSATLRMMQQNCVQK